MDKVKEIINQIKTLFSQQKNAEALAWCDQAAAAYAQDWEVYALRGRFGWLVKITPGQQKILSKRLN